jgi:hypothetical protein
MHSRLAGTYVELTREEFEDWLNSKGFRGKWRIHPRYDGVYLPTLSDTVAISINSTTGSREQVMSKGRASMKMRLVSRVTNKVLLGPKKLMGKTHFARTTNWRQNWGKGLDRAKQTYDGSRSFYDAIAVIEDRLQYMDDTMDLIEQIPGWQQDSLLADLHRKVSQGGILTTKQLAVVQKARRNPPAPEPSVEVADEPAVPSLDEALLQRMRALYVAARNARTQDGDWTMDFVTKWAKGLKAGKSLSSGVRNLLDKKFQMYGV